MTWKEVFDEIRDKDYCKELSKFLDDEYAHHVIYPKRENLFAAFKLTPLQEVKVVIFHLVMKEESVLIIHPSSV